jgi:hypothetical protein
MIILFASANGQNSAYRHLYMKGAFENEGALLFSTHGIGWQPRNQRTLGRAASPT